MAEVVQSFTVTITYAPDPDCDRITEQDVADSIYLAGIVNVNSSDNVSVQETT